MANKLKLGILHTTIREDEKLLIKQAVGSQFDLAVMDGRYIVYNPSACDARYDMVLERCMSATVGIQATLFFESLGIKTVNSSKVSRNCENKFLTSLLFAEHKITTVPFALVFNEEMAKKAVDQLGGYPIVVKPVSGSWGRLLAKVNDEDALEGIIEQKLVLGSPIQKALYLQKYIEKPERDIRAVIVGNQLICAIYRYSSHWITNTARGAKAVNCQVDGDLRKICLNTADAVGGGILGIDIFETDDGYLVNEVNHTMEFKNVQRATGVNVAAEIIDYLKKAAKK